MAGTSPLKHVIFLGAGASVTSGYPAASDLRLRLSSERQMEADLQKLDVHHTRAAEIIRGCFADFKASVELFRHGGFGSVDEFAKLASVKYPEHVQVLKRLTHLGLALHNPEDNFQTSDYYPFIQRLFNDRELYSLKSHITLLSYNYDCFLDYLLIKAQTYRSKLAGKSPPTTQHKNCLSSGFFAPADAPSLTGFTDAYPSWRKSTVPESRGRKSGEPKTGFPGMNTARGSIQLLG
jgi:hypothetical protein